MLKTGFAVALAFLPAVLSMAYYDVQVGAGGQLLYSPEYVTAHPGDVITFHFNPKNHSVTQSSLDKPCEALYGGTDLGFVPVAADAPVETRQFTVPAGETPLWFYCRQTEHCGQGMVFAINPGPEGTPADFRTFKANALATAAAPTDATAAAPTDATAAPTDATAAAPTGDTAAAPMVAAAVPTVATVAAPADAAAAAPTVATAAAPSDTTAAAPTVAAEPTPQHHRIVVGADGALAYSPSNIQAAVGDIVTFEFRPKNHTVTQSSFDKPCTPLEESTGTAGFTSGFQPVAADATEFPTFNVTVNDTTPIWGYCGQATHCQSGMVFSINAPAEGPNTYAAFVELAKNSGSDAAAMIPRRYNRRAL